MKKEKVHPKADLTKVPIDCPLYGEQPFCRCRDRCVDKCKKYFDMVIELEMAHAIAKGKRRRSWWSARNRAAQIDEQIEDAYLSRSDEKAMMRGEM